MHLRTLAALATLAFAGQTVAQCGAIQLTTPPNFVSNNGGSSGGAVYFSLSTLAGAPNGVSICGFSINTSASAGSALNATVYRHLTLTNVANLNSLSPADWCPITTASGTSNGIDVPSPMTLTSPIDIAPGTQVLLALAADNYPNRYTNGNGANQTVADGNLQFDAGKASNVSLTGGLFNPRVANLIIDYDLAAAPVANTPCGVVTRCDEVGAGCGGIAAQVYEIFPAGAFDLGSSDVFFLTGGGNLSTVAVASTPIVPPVAAPLGLGDDENSAPIPLGFEIDGLCADSISVASNGYIWLGTEGAADFTPSESEFVGEGARLAVYWTDLTPAAGGGGGTIHVDVNPMQVLVTFQGLFEFGGAAPEVTAQVEITPAGCQIRYDAAGGAYAADPLVGLSNGIAPAAPPGSVDISAGGALPVPSNIDLTLACVSEPSLGSTAEFRTSGVPSGAIAGTVVSFGAATVPGIPLAPLTPPGCEQYVAPNFTNLGLIIGAASCSGSLNLTVPNNPQFLGTQLAAQSASLGVLVLTSNGLDIEIGNF